MKTVAAVVREIIDESEIALSALQSGILNLSAFAKKIREEVSSRAGKPVTTGSIVVALSRYEYDAKNRAPLTPTVLIESISTRSNLTELTFARTQTIRTRLKEIHENTNLLDAEILTVTSGVREVSLIVPSTLKNEVIAIFSGTAPTLVLEELACLTVRFPARYLHTPNTIFTLLRPLALNRINIVEVVSTYTELSIIVAEEDLQSAFTIFSKLPTI
jgi:hypothetical protein